MGSAAAELRACLERCALVDRSHLIRLRGDGPDLLDLLHRLSTKDLAGLAPGEGCVTVLTTGKGRIVERLFVHHLGDEGVLLVGGPGDPERVLAHLARYTFAEQTGLRVDRDTFHFALIGPAAGDALDGASLPRPAPLQVAGGVDGARILGQDGVSASGYSIVGPTGESESWRTRLQRACVDVGGTDSGPAAAEAWRVLRGHPAGDAELTEDHNPLEAGLRDAVDFDKGCYVGQEVIARLNTYDKVVREVMGLRLPAGDVPRPGAAVWLDDKRAGTVTSATSLPGFDWAAGLAFIHRNHRAAGATVRIGTRDGAEATLVELPFAV